MNPAPQEVIMRYVPVRVEQKKRLEPKILGDEEYVLIEWASVQWRIAETAVNSPSGVSSSSVRVAEITPLKVLLSHLSSAFCTMMRAWIF